MNIARLIRHASVRGLVTLTDGQQVCLKGVRRARDGRRKVYQARIIYFDGRERTIPLDTIAVIEDQR